MSSASSGPTDWILRYIKLPLPFFFTLLDRGNANVVENVNLLVTASHIPQALPWMKDPHSMLTEIALF